MEALLRQGLELQREEVQLRRREVRGLPSGAADAELDQRHERPRIDPTNAERQRNYRVRRNVTRNVMRDVARDVARDGVPPVSTAQWVLHLAKDKKRKGQIPPDIGRHELARMLNKALKNAARKYPERTPPVPSVGDKHITNELARWGCWPVNSIPE